MFELHLKGFKTKEQVQALLNWYQGQGEQYASNEFEILKEEGDIDVGSMNVEVEKRYEWEGNALIAFIKPE